MEFDLSKIANLRLTESGIWECKNSPPVRQLAYPEGGHIDCLQLEENSFWFSHRNRCILSLVKSFPPNGPILDVGGGNGFVSHGLERSGYDSMLLEPGTQGVCNARKRGVSTILNCTLEEAGFPDHCIPAIGLFDVLEHIEDDRAFLDFIRSKLARNGRLYLTVPAFKFLWSHEDEHACHVRRYQLSQLNKILKSAGFVVDYSTYIFWFLPLPIFLFRSLPNRLGFRRQSNLQKNKREHTRDQGIGKKFVNKGLGWELNRIQNLKRLIVGGSCLVTARSQARE